MVELGFDLFQMFFKDNENYLFRTKEFIRMSFHPLKNLPIPMIIPSYSWFKTDNEGISPFT